jgi:hypothetical protein
LIRNIIIIQFFIYLRAELNSQWPELARIQTAIRQHMIKLQQIDKKQNKTKMDHLRLFTLKYDLLKISVNVQTAFASETHLADGQ